MEIKYNKLAGIRATLGMNQTELANKIGMTKQTYCRKENGQAQFKDEEKIAIKEIFSEYYKGITIDDIFF